MISSHSNWSITRRDPLGHGRARAMLYRWQRLELRLRRAGRTAPGGGIGRPRALHAVESLRGYTVNAFAYRFNYVRPHAELDAKNQPEYLKTLSSPSQKC